tara:strand:- start:259 stop:534 length:276 start_codon:yes stop_codon:yes gene_type:complete
MTFFSRFFLPKYNDTNLGIILENNGAISESTSSYKPTQCITKTTTLLNNKLDTTTNSSINNDTYCPPTKYYNSPKKEESPFSPFKIWGQKT